MTDWAKAYNGLFAAGFTDDQIAGLAGVTRAVVNAVRNSNYPFNHEPGYEGGKTVLANLKHAVEMNWIDPDYGNVETP